MNSKIDLSDSISKYLPKIHEFFKKKNIKPSKENYYRALRAYHKDIEENDLKSGLDEFVGRDGDFIKGDMNFNKREIFVGIKNPETTDDFVEKTAQGPRYYWNSQFASTGMRTNEAIAEGKMKKMIEDFMMGKNKGSEDLISKSTEIPDIDSLKTEFDKPIIVRKTKYLVDMMQREGVTGEEFAIVLNYILSIESKDIPSHYKNILINKLKNG
jgi:hypothetical protein